MYRIIVFSVTACLSIAAFAAEAERVLLFADPDGDSTQRYRIELITRALAGAERHYHIVTHAKKVSSHQVMLAMKRQAPDTPDIHWTMGLDEQHKPLKRVDIPVFMGLFGWRIPVVHKARRELFKALTTLDELQTLTAGSASYWLDTEIMQYNQLPVQTARSRNLLYPLLISGRVDYLPRGLLEYENEIAHYANLPLAADPYIALHYPVAIHFIVNNRRPELYQDLRQGMENLLHSGELSALFTRYFGTYLARSRLSERQIIELDAPFLSISPALQDAIDNIKNGSLVPEETPP